MKPFLSKLITAIILFIAFSYSSFAQTTEKKITSRTYGWFSYFNTLQLSSKWSITTDFSERFFFDNGNQFQNFYRSMANVNLGQNWVAGAGFAYVRSRTFDPASTSTLAVPELRPYQEFSYRQKLTKVSFSHRYRIEERFIHKTANGELTEGYNFNFRFRYQFAFDYNLYKSKDNSRILNLRSADEVMFNAGKSIVNNPFDQNRFTVGLNYQPVKNLNVQLDYMYIFQQRSTAGLYNHGDVVRLQVFQRIDLHKK